MTQAQRFGQVLARVRKEQGFASAHSFYKVRDGRRSFRMTFRNYLNVEQGKNIPKPERVEAIMTALGLEEHSAQARELAQAYFAALGLTELARHLGTAKNGAIETEDSSLLEQAARQHLQHKAVHLTREQWKTVAEDFEAYLCDDLLQMTNGGLSLPELARQTGLKAASVKRAVAALAAAGMVKVRGGTARSVYEGKVVEAAPSLPAWVGIQTGLFKHQERLAAEGSLVQNSIYRLRMTETDLKRFRRHVDQLILLATLYEKHERTDDSAVYLVRGQVFRVLPKKSAQRD